MKIMIPASGGLDSTVLLWKTLRETDHDVIAVHFDDAPYMAAFPGVTGKTARDAIKTICAWLRSEVRDVTLDHAATVRVDPGGNPFPSEPRPVRPGFASRSSQEWLYCRYASMGAAAKRLGVDQTWVGLTTWNLGRGNDWRVDANNTYKAYAGEIPLVRPFLTEAKAGNAWPAGRSRLRNRREIPSSLLALVAGCRKGSPPCGTCYWCVIDDFYKTHCADLSDANLLLVEKHIEKIACVGAHYDEADPETFRSDEMRRQVADYDWKSWRASALRDAP